MSNLSDIESQIDYALNGHSAGDRLTLILSEYNRLSKIDRECLVEALFLRLLTAQSQQAGGRK